MAPYSRILVVLALALLGACSSTTFLYNRLDFILPWYLDDYVELDRDQRQQFDRLLDPFLDWHREEELPAYVAVLDQIEGTLGQPVTTQEMDAIAGAFEAAWLRLEGRSLDWLLALGASLSDEQVAEFLQNLDERQQEYEEKYLSRSEEEYREEMYDNLLDRAQDYLGRLDGEQKAALRAASEAIIRSDRPWLEERARWHARLAELLQREPGWEQRVRDAVARREETLSEDYREAYTHNLALIQQTIVDLLNSRSERQERRLRGEIADLREDLLAARDAAKGAEAAQGVLRGQVAELQVALARARQDQEHFQRAVFGTARSARNRLVRAVRTRLY